MFNFAQKTSTRHLPLKIISHLSATVSQFILENEVALSQWFNERYSQDITTQYTDHLLIQIQKNFNRTLLEQVCASYHDTTQQRAPILHTVVKYLYGWS